jgi:hypothetical protein
MKVSLANLGYIDARRCYLCQEKRRVTRLLVVRRFSTDSFDVCGRCLLGLTMQVLQGKTWQPPKKGE